MTRLLADPFAYLFADGRQQFRPMHPGIALALGFHAALLLLTLAALPLDHRTILGLNPWVKPLKFDLSTLIYAGTIGLLLSHLARSGRGWSRGPWRVGWAIAVSMVVENTLIGIQSLRGVPSHMNYTSLLNGLSFAVMGIFILVNTVALAVLLRLFLQPSPDPADTSSTVWPPAVVAGARLGLLVLLLGSAEGVAMVLNAGHTVGAHDSGDGLPFVNWSTAHGDLRIAHFFALHALQAFLLLGWLLSRTRQSRATQIGALVTFAVTYIAGCGWLFHTAMRGQPLLGL